MLLSFGICAGIFKILILLLKRGKIQKILKSLHNAPFIPNVERGGDFEQDVVKTYVRITRIQVSPQITQKDIGLIKLNTKN